MNKALRYKRVKFKSIAASTLVFLSGCIHRTRSNPVNSHPQWVLTWSDEFNQPDGSPPDPARWKIETGGNGWGNNELEYYTSRLQNLQIQNGNLQMTALKETYTGSDGVTRDFTSARLDTK